MFHVAADHTLPLKRLVDFDRLRLAQGEKGACRFDITSGTFASSTASGGSTVYAGVHQLVLWRGNGEEQVFNVTL